MSARKQLKFLPTVQCNPIVIVEKAKQETPKLYKELADEYYKTPIGGTEFLAKHTENRSLAWAIVQLR